MNSSGFALVSLRRRLIAVGGAALAAVVAVLALASSPASAAPACGAGTLVQTSSGGVCGLVVSGDRQWLGIPYAAAPAGGRRWEPPQPPASWSGVRAAFQDPGNCPQLAGIDPGLTTNQLDEDCLGLDVIAPRRAADRLRPVYVFIHGGAFIVGHLGFENMSQLVEKTGIVAVTINYRLGALGFLDLPGMASGAGNFGILDQQAALRWVQRNIRAFGGDPANVTVGGQSAGGGSVCAQLASPLARGLFERAVLESGWDCNDARTHADARAQSIALAHQVGCTDDSALLACMRSKPVLALLQAQSTFPLNVVGPTATWAPETGTSVLPQSPALAFADGAFNRVPLLLGSNSADIPGLGCLTQGYALHLSRWVPTYRYQFDDETAPPLPGRPPSQAGHGAQHSAELEYLYLFNGLPANLNAGQRALANQMIGYWSRFIDRGNPNRAGLVRWPALTSGEPHVLILTAHGIRVTTAFAQANGCM